MKLNPSCIRGILLTAEEQCDFDTPWEYNCNNPKPEHLVDFSHEEIIYHIRQAEQSDLIQGVHYYDGGATILVFDLTPHGHEFLDNVRTDSVWKKVLRKGSNASLPVLMELAKDIALQYFLG